MNTYANKKAYPEILSCLMEATCGFWWCHKYFPMSEGKNKRSPKFAIYSMLVLVITKGKINAQVAHYVKISREGHVKILHISGFSRNLAFREKTWKN